MNVRIGTAQRPAAGQTVCGDAIVVIRREEITVAVADGLGHGPVAAEAARAFCAFVEANPIGDLEQVLRAASRSLSGTRGAAAALLCIDELTPSIRFAGIGNIEVKALSNHPIHPICVPGIVGRSLARVTSFEYTIDPGDLLALHSDGVSKNFELARYRHFPVTGMAEAILAEHGMDNDDATCVVIKC